MKSEVELLHKDAGSFKVVRGLWRTRELYKFAKIDNEVETEKYIETIKKLIK
jgi:methionine synthase II (cobalamin-independent)